MALVGGARRVGTVGQVDPFEELMAAERGLRRHFELMDHLWSDTSAALEVVAGMCDARRLVTSTTVTFAAGSATVAFECGSSTLTCRGVPEFDALEAARAAAGRCVDLRLAGFEPDVEGWALHLTAHCDTPFPFRKLRVPMRSLHVDREQVR